MTYAPTQTNRLGRPAGGSGLQLPLRQVFEYVGRLLEARRGRREIVRLAWNDDALLADVGVARSDVESALMQPWDADPSQALAMSFERRKAASRRMRRNQ